jgi:hypothetical protein
MENQWPIEIDGWPSYKMGGFSMAMLNNQGVYKNEIGDGSKAFLPGDGSHP